MTVIMENKVNLKHIIPEVDIQTVIVCTYRKIILHYKEILLEKIVILLYYFLKTVKVWSIFIEITVQIYLIQNLKNFVNQFGVKSTTLLR